MAPLQKTPLIAFPSGEGAAPAAEGGRPHIRGKRCRASSRKGKTEVHARPLLPLVDALPYNRKDLIEGIPDLLVGKPNDANPMGFEELLPLDIVRRP